jgi:hypothetical protein
MNQTFDTIMTWYDIIQKLNNTGKNSKELGQESLKVVV